MANHETVTKTVITRAWTDLEPKFVAWLTAGGLVTAASLVYSWIDPNGPVPVWVGILAPFVAGLVISYLKKTSIKVTTPVESAAALNTAATTPVENADDLGAPDLVTPSPADV